MAYRKYSKAQKMSAVIAAEMTSVAAAAESSGIPETTLAYWFDAPEFVEIRRKTREDLASESMGMAHMVLKQIRARLGDFEPRDLAILFGILTDKGQLLAGHATERVESLDLTHDDHEREALRNAIQSELARRRVERQPPSDAEQGGAVEAATPAGAGTA